ncbi:MAG: hypothetical protein JWO77_938 [Ilumatobacteraceae bacterium]|nr:hypothetical protein [Ilumatobacteraceae bacterium]
MVLGVAAVAAAAAWHTTADLSQQQVLVEALSHGRLADAFAGAPQTSGPGFGLFALPFFLVARVPLGTDDAYLLASLAALAALVPAAVAACRAVGVTARSWGEVGRVAAIVGGVPVLSCYWEAFHPADVLAVAASLAAFATWSRRMTGATAALLGFALATRQWAVIVVAVLVVLADRADRVRLAIGSVVVAAALLIPFVVANPTDTMATLAAKHVGRFPLTAPGIVAASDSALFLLSRYLPLALAAGLCLWLVRRVPGGAVAVPELAVAALAAGLLLRPLVDPAGFTYYLAPGLAFLALVRPASWSWPVLTVGFGVALLVRRELSWRFPTFSGFEGPMAGGAAIDAGDLQAVGALLSVAETLLVAAIIAACLLRLRALSSTVGGGSSAERAAGGPGHAEAGDGLLG